MSEIKSAPRRRRRRSHRQLRYLLLVVGATGLSLGLPLSLWYLSRRDPRMMGFFLVYVFASLAALGVRGILTYLDDQRRSCS